jgi:hypothetical protein
MRTLGDWWKEIDSAEAPRARWFGIFPRELRLRERAPGRLTVPSFKVGSAEGLPIQNEESISTPNSLKPEWPLTPAANLIAHHETWLNGQSGSVALAGVLVNEDPMTPHFPQPQSRALGSHGKMYPATKAEVPLSKRLAYLLQPPTDLLLSRSGPIEWPAALFEYQLDGIKALLSRDALLLADDMGLGKTIQAIGALRVLILQHRVEAALLIVPAGLVTQWQKELRHWAPELRISTVRGPTDERAWQWTTPAHVYLTGYETLRSDFTDNPQSPPHRRLWDVVIIDEAQKIKNRGAEVSRKCKQLLRRRAWALTGTPLENSVDDLASILEFVSPLTDGGAPLRLTPGPELRERHQNLQLRRKKTDVLAQLPPKIVSQIALPLEGAQRDTYERAEREGVIQLREKGETVRAENVLELIMRLKQICNFCPATGQSAKLADIRDRINTLESEGYRASVHGRKTWCARDRIKT